MLSNATIVRLATYLDLLKEFQAQSRLWISSSVMSRKLGISTIAVRKDLAATGIVGRPKKGFPIHRLIRKIEHILHWDREKNAIIVGAGNLGRALLSYQGFETAHLFMVAAFDVAPLKESSPKPVFSMEELEPFLQQHDDIELALLCVPKDQAQTTAERLVKTGQIKKIWNFTPALLALPADIRIENSHMLSSFALLSTPEIKTRKSRKS